LVGVSGEGIDSKLIAHDQLGRPFSVNLSSTYKSSWTNSFGMNAEHIDQHDLTSHTEYLINGNINNFNGLRLGTETRNSGNTINGRDEGATIGAMPKNYTIGMPSYWKKGSWSVGAQYTTLHYNPWVAMGGSWGTVTQTGTLDHTIRYSRGGFSAVGGAMYTSTQMTPGLITKVNDIYGAWGEVGYRWNGLGIYSGLKPVVLSGSVQARLPTSVDNNGNLVYTTRTLGLQNQSTGYLRALWSTDIRKNTVFRMSGTVMSNGQYRIMNEFRFFIQ